MDFSDPDITVQAPIWADPVERLLAPPSAPRSIERTRLVILFVVFLAFHIGLLALILLEYGFDPPQPPEQEIAVELAPPPEQPAPEPPPQKPEKEQPKQEQKPPPSPDLKPADDAPRAPNKETVDRDASDKETQSPRAAPPSEQAAQTPKQTRPSEAAKASPAPTPGPDAQKTALEKPDAEPIERAELKPDTQQPTTSPDAAEQSAAGLPTIPQMMAQMKPVPDYRFAGAAAATPVSGGSATPSYLSTLYGLIMPHMRVPPNIRVRSEGVVVIYIDTIGHVLHLGVLQPSGSPELDTAALTAVRLAGPFPAPPPGMPPVRFTYGQK